MLLFAGLLLLPALPWVFARLEPELASSLAHAAIPVLLTAAALLWAAHLWHMQRNTVVVAVLAPLMGAAVVSSGLHHTEAKLGNWLSALGCAIFVYAMVSVFRMQSHDGGLQAIATAALSLSLGMIAKPPVLLVCALFSVVAFYEDRRHAGGLPRLILLLFTPFFLCLGSLIFLSFLYYGTTADFWWDSAKAVVPHWPLLIPHVADLWPVAFALAVVLSRATAGQAGRADAAFFFLMLFLPALRWVPWIPDPVSELDMSAMLTAGAASLLAAQPLRRTWELYAPLAVLCGATSTQWSQ